jgi:anti-sigma factor RsiW
VATRDRFEELVADFLDGTLDEAEAIELDALLAADADRAALFVELTRQDRVLAASLGPKDDLFARRVLAAL